ncbi:hypothetical protein GQ457_12G024150 [Hibiscus cannabinus]
MEMRIMRVVVVLVLVLGSDCHGCWDQERTALLLLKPYFDRYVDGVSKWGQRANCCEWANVECDISTGRLTRLFLNTSNSALVHDFFFDPIVIDALTGWGESERKEWYLNVSLFLPFQQLNTLSLSQNNIAGFLNHQEKGELALSKLEVLDLSYNLFNNSVLSFFGLFPNLKSLDISSNRLEGEIHVQDNGTELRLMNLETLDLFGNSFNSSILASIGRLSNLKSLSLTLGVSNITESIDLIDLKALTHLEDLTLYCYDDSHSLAVTDSNCRLPLQSLSLFPFLKTVDLEGFNIEGTIMTSQNNKIELRLMNLEMLALDDNIFNSSILPSFGRLSNLKTLRLGGPNLTGSIDLTELNGLTYLEDLSLDCYDYEDSSLTTTGRPCSLPLESLGLFPSLKTVWLDGFDIEGSTRTSQSDHWHTNFTNLEELVVYSSSLRTNILGSIRQFTSLKRLFLRESKMDGSLNILEVEVVDILEGNSGSLQSNTLASAIQHMLHLEWDVRIRKIGRDYNRAADALARASRGAPVGETIFDSIPSVVYDLLQEGF